jgi:hypothetical protein
MSRHRDKGASPRGRRRPAPSGSPHGEHGHWEQGGLWDQVTILGSQNGNGPLTSRPGPVKKFFQNSTLHSNLQIKKGSIPLLQNIKTLHGDKITYFEELSKLGRLQILNKIHAINFVKEFNMKFL